MGRPRAPAVHVDIATAEAPVPAGTDIPAWVRATIATTHPGTGGAVAVRLVGLAEGKAHNERWRGKPGATNVLAFPAPALPLPARAPRPLGDLAICLPVVHREAADQGKSPVAHLAHLVVHGTLHLLGHTHDGDEDARLMETTEARILADLGFRDPYAAE